MKIQALSNNFKYKSFNPIRFQGSATMASGGVGGSEGDEFNKKDKSREKPIPDWMRKAMIFTCVFFAFKNDPVVQNMFNDKQDSEVDDTCYEFFEDVQKMRKEKAKSSAFYHLNRFADIEMPEIKKIKENTYSLKFDLDNQKVDLTMNLDKDNKDTISGVMNVGEQDSLKYKAIFSPDNIKEFKVVFKDEDDSKIVIGRDFRGELYKVSDGKKLVLNNKNVEKYEQYQKDLELLDSLSFFTNENGLWRNLNFLLLAYLLLNEAARDAAMRRKNKEGKDGKDDNEVNTTNKT